MLKEIFQTVVNLSFTACFVIGTVLLARLMLKRSPKILSYALWAVVLVRLLCPVLPAVPFSPVPQVDLFPRSIIPFDRASPMPPIETAPATAVLDHPPVTVTVTIDYLSLFITLLPYLWAAGVVGMVIYSGISYGRLRKRIKGALRLEDNLYSCSTITSPFVIGLFRPRIYLPEGLTQEERDYILLHERHHIRRGDPLFRLIAFLALCIHWFNPLVWLSYVLSSRDMEMSCDEAVIRRNGAHIRADYCTCLLKVSLGTHPFSPAPLAFSEGDIKGRIQNLARWKKPGILMAVLAVVFSIALGGCLLTESAEAAFHDPYGYYLVVTQKGVYKIEYEGLASSAGVCVADGSDFRVGERVLLEDIRTPQDLRGLTISLVSREGEVLASLSIPAEAEDGELDNLLTKSDLLEAPKDWNNIPEFHYTIDYSGLEPGEMAVCTAQVDTGRLGYVTNYTDPSVILEIGLLQGDTVVASAVVEHGSARGTFEGIPAGEYGLYMRNVDHQAGKLYLERVDVGIVHFTLTP